MGRQDSLVLPQWGRLSSSRITPRSRSLTCSTMSWPQWGRLSSSRITLTGAGWSSGADGPQWGRLSSSRITRISHMPTPSIMAPQWGRLSSSRITGAVEGGPTRRQQAAMGPALIEPDHRPARRPGRARQAWPQWGRLSSSRITENRPAGDDRGDGRNGAGSHRAGSHMWPLRNPCRHKRRNGAGSHRAGSPGTGRQPIPALTAAMGPALIEPDHPERDSRADQRWEEPQWGRLSSSRITSGYERRPTVGAVAAMGPALIEPDH